MKRLHQEVVRVVLLDGQLRCITKVDISSGTADESLAAPREIFRPAIIHSAYAFVLVHNHPSGSTKPSEADRELTKRVAAAAQILQIQFLDHIIGATQGTLRYNPISRLCLLDNFRFQYWPWQFPDKIDCPAAFFNAL